MTSLLDYQTTAGGAVLLDSRTLAAPAATITFPNIPQGFNDLFLEILGRSNVAANVIVGIQYNGDAGGNYDYQYLRILNAAISGAPTIGFTAAFLGNLVGSGATAGFFSPITARIAAYTHATHAKYSQGIYDALAGAAATSETGITSGVWHPAVNAAINRITLIDLVGAASFDTGSTARLYGLP